MKRQCTLAIFLLLAAPRHTAADTSAPGIITDLTVTPANLTSKVRLSWTSPGDNGSEGMFNGSFLVEVSTNASNAWDSWNAQFEYSASGIAPGKTQSFTEELWFQGTTYYFKAWAIDTAGNLSGPSNTASLQFPWKLEAVSGQSLCCLITPNAMAIDSDGHVHFAYVGRNLNDSNYHLNYSLWKNGQFLELETQILPFGVYGLSLAVDSTGKPHILYNPTTGPPYKIYYRRKTSSGWEVSESMLPEALASYGSQYLALDANNVPHACYGGEYWTWSGETWLQETFDSQGVCVALRLDAAGRPHIAYRRTDGTLGLSYARRQGAAWLSEPVTSGEPPSHLALQVDGDSLPGIAYLVFDSALSQNRLRYASFNGTAWSDALIDTLSLNSPDVVGLTLDGLGLPHIAYTDMAPGMGKVKHAKFNGVSWSTRTIDESGRGWWPGNVAFDPLGRLHIAYTHDSAPSMVNHGYTQSEFYIQPASLAPPKDFLGLRASSTSILWSWTDRGSHETGFRVRTSTEASNLSGNLPPNTVNWTETGLSPGSTYARYVQTYNQGGFADSTPVAVFIPTPTPPLPPSGLLATVSDEFRIRLEWQPSPSSDVLRYKVYWDDSTGAINYGASLATVPSNTNVYLTAPLTPDKTYRFGLRAESTSFAEEQNSNVVASVSIPVASQLGLAAAIKVPKAGRRVGGNRVTIVAEILQGQAGNIAQVEFQYRSAASTTSPWNVVSAANSAHFNPDDKSPYFIHWDVSGMAASDYELRAVVTSIAGIVDASPSTIVITVDNASPETEEKIVANVLQKREMVFNTVEQSVSIGDQATDSITQVTVPPGALSAASTTIKISINPAGSPSPPPAINSVGQIREITLDSGQTSLNSPATLIFQYEDADNDGIVDGTSSRAENLSIYAYNTVSGQWRKEAASSINKAEKTVVAQTTHFSLFGLFALAVADLSDVLVYPVPWVPNDGDNDNGKPYSSGDPSSGILFENLTQGVKIEVFTVTGELVWEHSTDASSNKVRWDVRNKSGRDVASGGYFSVITDKGSGTKVVRKLAVIR